MEQWSSSEDDIEPNVVIPIEPKEIDQNRTLYINENMYALYPSFDYCKHSDRHYGQLTFDAHIIVKLDKDGNETNIKEEYFGQFEFKSSECRCSKNIDYNFEAREYDIVLRKIDNNGRYSQNATLRLEETLSNDEMKKINFVMKGHSNIEYIVDPDCLENSEWMNM